MELSRLFFCSAEKSPAASYTRWSAANTEIAAASIRHKHTAKAQNLFMILICPAPPYSRKYESASSTANIGIKIFRKCCVSACLSTGSSPITLPFWPFREK